MKSIQQVKRHLVKMQATQQKMRSAASKSDWVKVALCLQAIAIEEFEYYAIYESNLFDLGISFITLKPIEYLCELLFETAMLRLAKT